MEEKFISVFAFADFEPTPIVFWQHDVLIIPKSTKPLHIVENTRIFDFELTPEDLETMEKMNEGVHYCWNPDAVL